MLSFRKLFLITAATLAAFTSASPVDGPSDGITHHSHTPPLGVVENIDGLAVVDDNSEDYTGRHQYKGRGIRLNKIHVGRSDKKVPSLCEILDDVDAKLKVISEKMSQVTATTSIDANKVVIFVTEVKIILGSALVKVKELKGRPMKFVLSRRGQVLTIAEVCNLLLNVLNEICDILSSAFHIAGTTSATIMVRVGAVWAELLGAIFTLVDDLYATIRPDLPSVVKICTSLKLDAVVAVLDGKH
ncbi:hypothetical protein H0H81_009950 [Sphagnurus paluster]|uniref:Uncharacterized protein n=1 Tax=Sphagnurus paluster TaxID=117069 RepID=A0A9P7KIN6_9AGAR|nr:hypothetical protein H0H81_009950 [Sphagnurus paluster]